MTKLFLTQILFCITFISSAQQGALDFDFGDSGAHILFDNDNSLCFVEDMFLDSENRILICGYHSFSDTNNGTFVLRLNPDGTPDVSFADNGVLKFADAQILGSNCFGVVERPDGNYILGTNYVDNQGDERIELIEVDENGQINTDFGNNGTTTSAVFENPILFELALSGENKIVVSYTTFYTSDFAQRGDCVIHQFLSNGQIDAGFGTAGKIIIGTAEADDRIFDIDIDDNNNIYVSGYLDSDFFTLNPTNGMVISVNSNGQLRSDWGTNGIALYSDNTTLMTALGVDIADNGDVLCVGASFSPDVFQQSGLVARLNSSGQLVTSFGTNGFAFVEMTEAEFRQVRETPDLNVVAAGIFLNSENDDDVIVAKMNASGNLVNAFGTSGVSEPWDLSFGEEEVTGMAIQPDGKILVAGYGFASTPGGGGGGSVGGEFIGETGYVLRYLNGLLTDVETLNEMQTLNIFPNPASDFISFKTDMPIAQIQLSTVAGQIMQTLMGSMTYGAEIDIADLVSGMYLIQVQFADGSQTVSRFVKK